MIQETKVLLRKQTPTAPNEWLYEQTLETRSREVTHEDGTTETLTEEIKVRNFVNSVYLGATADPWYECTNEEKVQWEEEHKPISEPEKETEESVKQPTE